MQKQLIQLKLSFFQLNPSIRFTLQIATIFACFAAAPIISNAQENCSKALDGELRDELLISTNENAKEIYKRDLYRMNDEQAYDEYQKAYNKAKSTGGSGNLNFSIPGIPLPFEGGVSGQQSNQLSRSEFSKQFQRWRQEAKDQIDSEKYYNSNNYYSQYVRNEASIRAWGNCMADRSKGLFAYASRSNAKTVMLNVVYRPMTLQKVRLEFVTSDDITVKAKRREIIPVGEKTYEITGNVTNAFSIGVNAEIIDSEDNPVGVLSVEPIKIGPATLPIVIVDTPPRPSDCRKDNIAVDDGFIYWIENEHLYGTSLSEKTKTAIDLNGWCNARIAVSNGYIYWIQPSTGELYAMRMNGTRRNGHAETVDAGAGGWRIADFTVSNGYIYWTESNNDALHSRKIDGSRLSQATETVDLEGWRDADLAISGDYLYWTKGGNLRALRVREGKRVDGENQLIKSGIWNDANIAISRGKLFWAERDTGNQYQVEVRDTQWIGERTPVNIRSYPIITK